MNANEYQKLAMKTLNPNLSKQDILINGVMGLCGESGEVIESIAYKSLLSLMYYELFLDLKNGTIPNFCFECRKFYLPTDNHKCKK